jgi:hypothetical protein
VPVVLVTWTPLHAVAQAVSRWILTTEAQAQCQGNQCVVCGGQSGTGTGISLLFFCQYYSVAATYSLVLSEGWTMGLLLAAVPQRESHPM